MRMLSRWDAQGNAEVQKSAFIRVIRGNPRFRHLINPTDVPWASQLVSKEPRMNNKRSLYRITFTSGMVVIAMLMCCVALIGCPETMEMAGDVMRPTTPPVEETPTPAETTPTEEAETEEGTTDRGGAAAEDDDGDAGGGGTGGGFADDPNVDPEQ